jgi:hypothetical protein
MGAQSASVRAVIADVPRQTGVDDLSVLLEGAATTSLRGAAVQSQQTFATAAQRVPVG